jgi:hypothetical protein
VSVEKHKVTVYAPVTFEITFEQVEAYMIRLGWFKADYRCRIYEHPNCGKLRVYVPLSNAVMRLAAFEDREAADVLADIAQGQP